MASSAEIDKLTSQLAKDPRSRAFVLLAEEYVKIGMLQEAATVLEEGLKVYPSFVTALMALGRVYVQLKAPAKAQSILEEATKYSPDNVRAHKMLAGIYADQQNWDAAKRSCEMVLFGFAQDEEMLALKAELGGKRATEPATLSPPSGAQTPEAKTGLQGSDVPRLTEGGQPAESPTEGPKPSDHMAEPAVATTESPQAKTGEALEQTKASGSEPSPTGVQTGMARLEELLERVRQRRAPVRRQG